MMKDGDEVKFFIEHNDTRQTFLISITATASMDAMDLAASLLSLVDDIEKDPDNFLKTFIATDEKKH